MRTLSYPNWSESVGENTGGCKGPCLKMSPPSTPTTTTSLIIRLWAFSPLGDMYVALWSSQRHLQSSASALKIPSPFSSSVRHLYSDEEFNYANAHTLHNGGRHTIVGMAFLQHGELSSGFLDSETSPLSSRRPSVAIIRSFIYNSQLYIVYIHIYILFNSREQFWAGDMRSVIL